uniref:Putative coat protein n=1 Tax=Heracleum latent virus TaxID=48876 RepID=A0A6G9IVZ9_9VIRU|nr:putative coat protein [Heracleum latent virus]
MEGISRSARIRNAVRTLVLAGETLVENASEGGVDADMYLRTLFGYIALAGTSAKTEQYDEVDIIGSKYSANNLDPRGKIKVAEKVRAMMSFARVVPSGECKKATLRQMCEPFAAEARECLIILSGWGIYSRLACKISKLGQKEPQVMFDFNSGLDLSALSSTEAATIQALNSRLFRTEGAKSVFTAQSSVGEQAVEI